MLGDNFKWVLIVWKIAYGTNWYLCCQRAFTFYIQPSTSVVHLRKNWYSVCDMVLNNSSLSCKNAFHSTLMLYLLLHLSNEMVYQVYVSLYMCNRAGQNCLIVTLLQLATKLSFLTAFILWLKADDVFLNYCFSIFWMQFCPPCSLIRRTTVDVFNFVCTRNKSTHCRKYTGINNIHCHTQQAWLVTTVRFCNARLCQYWKMHTWLTYTWLDRHIVEIK